MKSTTFSVTSTRSLTAAWTRRSSSAPPRRTAFPATAITSQPSSTRAIATVGACISSRRHLTSAQGGRLAGSARSSGQQRLLAAPGGLRGLGGLPARLEEGVDLLGELPVVGERGVDQALLDAEEVRHSPPAVLHRHVTPDDGADDVR